MSKCCVLTCPNRYIQDEMGTLKVPDGMSFHRFPADADAAREWADALGLRSYRKFDLVCAAHFMKRDYILNSKRRMLHSFAVPTLRLQSRTSTENEKENDNQSKMEGRIHITSDRHKNSDTYEERSESIFSESTNLKMIDSMLYSDDFAPDVEIESVNFRSDELRQPRITNGFKKSPGHIDQLSARQCRVCSFDSVANLELFDKNDTINQSGRNLCSLLHVNIRLGDGLPARICRPCNTQLTICAAFQKSALEMHDFYINVLNMESDILNDRSPSHQSMAIIPSVSLKDVFMKNVNETTDELLDAEFLDDDFLEDSPLDDESVSQIEECQAITPSEIATGANKTCPKCHLSFDSLSQHKCSELGISSMDCRNFGRQFRNAQKAAMHKCEEWTGFKACGNCHEGFTDQRVYQKHRCRKPQTKRIQSSEAVVCPVCCKMVSKNRLNIHLVRHSDERPFQCAECPKRYKIKHELKLHLTKHSNERRYVCESCGASYRYKHHLREHNRAKHSGLKIVCPFENCKAFFSRPKAMADHLNVIHGQAELRCPICNMAMRDRSRLKKHLQVHTRRGIKLPAVEELNDASEIEKAIISLS